MNKSIDINPGQALDPKSGASSGKLTSKTHPLNPLSFQERGKPKAGVGSLKCERRIRKDGLR